MRHYADPLLISFAEVEKLGAEEIATTPNAFGALVDSIRDDDLAFIVYTPGTTGPRKGVRLSHRALVAAAHGLLAVHPVRRQEGLVAVLPLAWIGDVLLSTAVFLVAGATLNCPEDTATARHDFREIGPAVALAPPRVWEGLYQEIAARIEASDALKRGLARWFFARAQDSARRSDADAARPPLRGVTDFVGEWLVFAPLRDRLGLRRLRLAFSTGGFLASDVRYGLRAIGVIAVPRGDEVGPSNVGKPVPGVAVRVAPNGEILVRTESSFDGYHKDPDATRAAVRDSWIATGDAGQLTEDGSLVVTDRMADLVRLGDGSTVAPQVIESQLRLSRYISQAVAIGQGRRYVAALICLDPVQIGVWASRHGVKLSGPQDAVRDPALQRLIRGEIDRINLALPANHRVMRFAILPGELRADDGELTRLHVVRRHVVQERYEAIIDALYESMTAIGGESGAIALRVVSFRRDSTAVVVGSNGVDLDREKAHG
jgi:long-chain acyl-CoA synthetase